MSIFDGLLTVQKAFVLWRGLINSLLTVLAQLLRPAGYSASDAGLVGALLLVAGLPSTAATAVALDRTHAYPALHYWQVSANLGKLIIFSYC